MSLARSGLGVAHGDAMVSDEFARRNGETMAPFTSVIAVASARSGSSWSTRCRARRICRRKRRRGCASLSDMGRTIFPSLLALESLAALALAWATYHRLSRARLGAPLRPLREFRFNDQLVWGLIVGLTIVLLPTLSALRDVGQNLLVFFGALYAVRGLGVLDWFMAPGTLGVALAIGAVLLFAPVLQVFAALAFLMLAVAAIALGLGDTWADWRGRAPARRRNVVSHIRQFDRSSLMEIILRQAVENLGKTGDVVNVKPGYARNYLLPARSRVRGDARQPQAHPAGARPPRGRRERTPQAGARIGREARAGVAHLLGARRRGGQAVRLRDGDRHRAAARGAGLPHREAADRPARADQGARGLPGADSPARRRQAGSPGLGDQAARSARRCRRTK